MVSVVVPIFNEEEILLQFHQSIAAAMKQTGEDWEVVYVNDGSKDSSLNLMLALQAEDPHVVVVELSRNWGHMGAISAGLNTAQGAAVVIMDGDFQDPPEVVPQLVNAWREGAQVVVAVRRSRQERRRILAKLFPLFYRVLAAISDYPIPLDAGIFGLLDRQAVDSINALREGNRYLPGLRAWVGYRNAVVLYDRHDRAGGEGKLTFLSRIKYATDAITSFSYKPLRLCLLLSCVSSCAAVILIISTVVSKAPLDSIGFGVAAAIFLVGAFVLFCMGILGEYLGRVYDEVRQRPLSIIDKVYYASAMTPAATNSGFESEEAPRIFRVA
jgi:polyisoprenyl-phosphate glycosyltransferase